MVRMRRLGMKREHNDIRLIRNLGRIWIREPASGLTSGGSIMPDGFPSGTGDTDSHADRSGSPFDIPILNQVMGLQGFTRFEEGKQDFFGRSCS